MQDKILVTQPTLPELEEFVVSLEKIWKSKWLTNNGVFHQELEEKLAEYLGVKYISVFSNGTLALMTAIQALNLKDEVITTPYSFVATAHSLWWNKIKPVFVDVEPITGNIDPEKIEKAITPKTTAILPVHVYGTPCNHIAIQKIAKKHNLKIIYDAAHAFSVKENNQSILHYGDLSILSFHATKVYNTLEGGAIVSHTAKMKKQIDYLKNFGFENEVTVLEPGINAKMNEVQAAYGVLQLKDIDKNIAKRKIITELYNKAFLKIEGVRTLTYSKNTIYNYSYYPIFIDKNKYGITRDELYIKLKENNIFARRYFYPLITTFPPYNKQKNMDLENAQHIAEQVLCLPIYPNLKKEEIKKIITIIQDNKK